MSDIRRQFSLDYLSSGREAPESVGEQALDDAVILYSQPIIKQLRAADNKQTRIHDLVQKLSAEIGTINFEEFLGVINHLVKLKFIEITEKDLIGNHLVRLLKP